MEGEHEMSSWRVVWSTDGGESWEEMGFEGFEGAQAFARRLREGHAGSKGFLMYAERMMVVSLDDLLEAESAGGVRLAPHMLGTVAA